VKRKELGVGLTDLGQGSVSRICEDIIQFRFRKQFLEQLTDYYVTKIILSHRITVDSRSSTRGLTALRLNRGNVFLKKKFYFP
jgi:hypothetical protein